MKVNDMKNTQRHSFALNPLTSALVLAIAAQVPANLAYANAGFGTVTDLNNATVAVPTYYASSPQGIRAAFDVNSPTGLSLPLVDGGPPAVTVDTGAPIRKFIDPLGGAYNGLESTLADTDLTGGIPVGIIEKWKNPLTGVQTKDDYYEIAFVEFTAQMHSDLAKPTRLRGYVQIETPAMVANAANCANHNAAGTACTDVTGVIASEHILATYPDGSLIKDANGNQVYFAHKPHYLGPAIVASHGTAVRIKFDNYLPYTDVNGKSVGSWNGQGGELAIPVDETIPGGGLVLDANAKPIVDPLTNLPIKMGQNRVAIHWHGGDTPWINDGTPHQWWAPKGDISYTLQKDADHPHGLGKGASAVNVPDMPEPGDGSYNFYYPNQELSGRLMFFHDHASGLTRLNVYEGAAAGYLVTDDTELKLVATALGTSLAATAGGLPTGTLDAIGIPLVLQDKTFVPKNIGPTAVDSAGKPASQDAKWDLNHWGQPGDLFFPHVYETNQDPNSIDGTNPVGRWDWGPWFWPVFPAQYSLPTGNYGDITTTPEAFMDTAVVNGKVYPYMTVDPKTYRFRILNAANDRAVNLGLYQAVDGASNICDAATTPVANPTQAYPGQGLPATCTEVRMVPAAPTPGFPATWPTDGRAGGVPDPATAGPDLVQIGNEAGLLPAVAVYKSQPVTYEQDVRSITVFNILDHGVLLMGAERADVLVDFSKYAGKTLILYNDAPAPAPGYDPRIDYYTGVGDQTAAGGAYDTLAGYGPNTRTFMQIRVNATNTSGTGGALDVPKLAAALPVAYAATQPAPIIPESVYNAAFGTAHTDNYTHIGTGSGTAPYWVLNGAAFAVTDIKLSTGGSLYGTVPAVTIAPPNCSPLSTVAVPNTLCVQATATATIDANGVVNGLTLTSPGAGYNTPPAVSFAAPGVAGGTTATAMVTTNGIAVINKAIQELFDPVYGRMNATLAAELPFSTATVATTIPLAYTDVPIEYLDGIKEGETQIWKITHNGVDAHPVHFHLVNVQLINRVGWDGVVKPPAANEVGWKETVRMNPLEDVYVVATAKHPVVPFGLPTSNRLLDPSEAVGATNGLTNIDPLTGAAPTSQTYLVNGVSTTVATRQYSNQMTAFDNEYVWHCHILGHEEFDFMRPMIFHPNVVVPDAPAAVNVNGNTVTWTDTTPYGGQDAQGIPTAGTNAAYSLPISSPKNEIGFKVYANVNLVNGFVPAGTVPVATVPANVTTLVDASGVVAAAAAAAVAPAAPSVYVVAYNAAGDSAAGTSTTTTAAGGLNGVGVIAPVVSNVPAPAAAVAAGPTGLTQVVNADGSVTLSWVAVPGATAYNVTNGGVPIACTAVTATSCTVAFADLSTGLNTLAVSATTLSGTTAATAVAGGLTNSTLVAPVAFAVAADTSTVANSGSITLAWANSASNKGNVAGLLLTWNGGPTGGVTFKPTTTGATVIGLKPGASYTFNLSAVSNATTVAAAAATAVTATAP
jgi:FtsP/CotA-like multicopper oxidase with cupredoxin domain